MNDINMNDLVSKYDIQEYERIIVNSALWAAAGDALGWMTELSRGYGGVKHRTGLEFVVEPVEWRRLIGGRSGVKIDLPAGTYSDDTQLRLSVCRAIRGDGAFDVEAFAKIEITVWQGYCLGAGIGSKAAATNLSKRGVNWFSNFFHTHKQSYTNAGGNGAAMRIQPHVWSAQSNIKEMIKRVLRDALVTHGHPHGFCGAIFHALCLWTTIHDRELPSLETARNFIMGMQDLPNLISEDSELLSFWLPTWERESKITFEAAIKTFCNEAINDIEIVESLMSGRNTPQYHLVLKELGCLTEKFRGSGFKTALAALVQAILNSKYGAEKALIEAANELESDTDTIATMSGALLGVIAKVPPSWTLQDKDYIEKEAIRMARIAFGSQEESFVYPDISKWSPPVSQSDSIVSYQNSLALVGVGSVKPESKEYSSRGSTWQWFSLPHGQTILAKRRTSKSIYAAASQFPNNSKSSARVESDSMRQQSGFNFKVNEIQHTKQTNISYQPHKTMKVSFPGLDAATNEIIASNFDDATIGRLLNQCIESSGDIEMAISLSAIIAKAKLVRLRRK